MFGMRYVFVREHEVGLCYENGRLVRQVGPGRVRLVSLPWKREEVVRVDTRRTELTIQGQEILTADGLSVRLNLSAAYAVADAERAMHSVSAYATSLYVSLQLLVRDAVQARTLEALMADRSALSTELLERARPQAAEIGLELFRVGVKDIILSGEVKKLLMQEMEALRTGRARLVAAREEVAATRARANTARILAESPALLRLRELEALVEVGQGMGNTVVLAVPPEQTALAATQV